MCDIALDPAGGHIELRLPSTLPEQPVADERSRMNLERLGKPIAVGRTGEIYAWDDDRVMKLYRDWSSRTYVLREARVSRIANEIGLPAPAVYDADTEDGLWEIDDRLGILYDWVEGPTMLRDLMRRPWMVIAYSKAMAALHAQMHAEAGAGLPDARQRIGSVIEQMTESLSESQRAQALDALAALPAGNRVCHGDFHPDNILLQEGGPVIVDWGPASCGHPLADVAWTYLLFTVTGGPVDTSLAMRLFLLLFRSLTLKVYLRTYFRLTGTRWADVERWLGVIAILRLGDGLPEERDRLLRLIEERFPDSG